ncbi:MAG: Ig-like domain-containing protein [bacterium]
MDNKSPVQNSLVRVLVGLLVVFAGSYVLYFGTMTDQQPLLRSGFSIGPTGGVEQELESLNKKANRHWQEVYKRQCDAEGFKASESKCGQSSCPVPTRVCGVWADGDYEPPGQLESNPPSSLNFDNPGDGDFVRGSITVSGDANDDETEIKEIGVYAGDTLLDTDASSTFSVSWNTTGFDDGSINLTAIAKDESGNTRKLEISVTIDNTRPSVSITDPDSGSSNPRNFSFNADSSDTESGVGKVTFQVDGTTAGTDRSSPYGITLDVSNYSPGDRQLTAVSADTAGNTTSDTVDVQFTDITIPSVTVSKPSDGDSISGSQLFEVSPSDTQSDISNVEFYIDGSLRDSQSDSPYTFSWDTTTDTDGPHRLVGRAEDTSGNVNTDTVTVTVDNTPPDITSITNPVDGDVLAGTTTYSGDANDTESGIKDVEFFVDTVSLTTDASDPYETAFNVGDYSLGSHSLSILATDRAGNRLGDTITVEFDDRTAPEVDILNPADGGFVTGTTPFEADAIDTQSGVSSVEFLVDGGSRETDSDSPYGFDWDTTADTDGTHSLVSEATDDSGNVGADTISVTVDNTPPDVTSITNPSDGDTVSDTVSIEVNASDTESGLNKVEFLVDGADIGTDKSSPYQVDWSSSSVPDGDHVLTAIGYDTASNTRSDSITVTTDNGVSASIVWKNFGKTTHRTSYTRQVGGLGSVSSHCSALTGDRILSSPALGNLDRGSNVQVLFGSWDGNVYSLESDCSENWSTSIGDTVRSSPALGDITGSDNLEIVVGSSDNKVHALDKDGSQLWAFTTGGKIFSSPVITDLDGDDDQEILVGSRDGKMYALDHNGDSIWEFQTDRDVLSSPAVGNLDGGSDSEVVFASTSGKILGLGTDGSQLWEKNTGNPVRSSPALADVDGDASLEVAIGSTDEVFYLLDANGNEEWTYSAGAVIVSSAAVGDIDGDASPEIAFGTLNQEVIVLEDDGTEKWTFGTGSSIISSPSLGDINNDGTLEVVIGSEDHDIYAIDSSGSQLWNFPTGNDVESSPAIGDIDGDGDVEVAVGSNDNKLYLLDN